MALDVPQKKADIGIIQISNEFGVLSLRRYRHQNEIALYLTTLLNNKTIG